MKQQVKSDGNALHFQKLSVEVERTVLRRFKLTCDKLLPPLVISDSSVNLALLPFSDPAVSPHDPRPEI
jgi:hypothetical protein